MKGLIERTLRTGRRNDMGFGMLIIRLGIAFTLIHGHGYGKLTNFESMLENFADPIGIGVTASVVLVIFAEFFCALLIGLGLFTRLAAIALIINFSVITFIANINQEFGRMETGLMYLIVFVGIFFIGAGRFSIDASMSTK